MRICMVCPGMGSSAGQALIGGHENTVVRLSKALWERGHKVILVTTPRLYAYPGPSEADLGWAQEYSLPVSSSYGSLGYAFGFLRKALGKIRGLAGDIDIIHGHSGFPELGLISGLAGRLNHKPSVHTVYCAMAPTADSYPGIRWPRRLAARLCLWQVDTVISLSRNTLRSLIRAGVPERKTEIIPPGIDLSIFQPPLFRPAAKGRLGLGPETPTLLYVGDLTRGRGLSVLIEALRLVVEQVPEVKLLLAVNMPLSMYQEGDFEIKTRIASAGLQDNVLPLGIVEDMAGVMAASDVFVAPYLSIDTIADYPVSMLEAMAVGRPVVATRVGGIGEIVEPGGNGWLVKPNQPGELAGAISRLLLDRERAEEMGRQGAQFVAENLGLPRVVDRLEALYRSLTPGS